MIVLRGGVIPVSKEIPVEIEVAYFIVSELRKRKLLKVRKEMIGDKPYYVWEINTEAEGSE